MTKKWCLMKKSDGQRGQDGKKKVYEIVVVGSAVHCEWGMAEKTARQRSIKQFGSEQAARWFALEKVHAKQDRGYEVVYAV